MELYKFPTVFANTMLEIEEIIIVNSIKTAIDFFNTLFFIFGTIRIYAEDYYVNSTLIMTECYIL